ncbi:hypothetical protein [Flavobacterium faecale]|uniref:hypothetical protein n=1 Tax=Flavobacterium faecale TaxID=1355330 RepID=UPI003AB0BD78
MKTTISMFICFISLCCSAQKKGETAFDSLSVSELNSKKIALELEANYVLVNHYMEQIEREDVTHMALTKIDKDLVNPYWKVGVLKASHDKWMQAASIISEFEKKHAPELSKLGTLLRNKTITRDEYFEKNREYRGKLRLEHPLEYPKLSENHISSLKSMWKLAGRYMLEDYKNKSMIFPVNWIPEDDRKDAMKQKTYKMIAKDLIAVDKELLMKKSN